MSPPIKIIKKKDTHPTVDKRDDMTGYRNLWKLTIFQGINYINLYHKIYPNYIRSQVQYINQFVSFINSVTYVPLE